MSSKTNFFLIIQGTETDKNENITKLKLAVMDEDNIIIKNYEIQANTHGSLLVKNL